MKISILKSYSREAQVFKVLSHPTRLFIVHELGKKDTCVCKLTEMVGDDISTISKHLSVLRNAGVVDSIRKGNQVIYRLKLRCALKLAACADFSKKRNSK